ncbi:MAG TPA: hypothetical protein VK891_13555, partial [Euzebyales bacterium]|nr:hypothetical protein [Euzebyales bacterium]
MRDPYEARDQGSAGWENRPAQRQGAVPPPAGDANPDHTLPRRPSADRDDTAASSGTRNLGYDAGPPHDASPFDRDGHASPFDRNGHAPSFDRNGHAPSFDRNGHAPSFDRNGHAPSFDRDDEARPYDRTGQPAAYGRDAEMAPYDRDARGAPYDHDGPATPRRDPDYVTLRDTTPDPGRTAPAAPPFDDGAMTSPLGETGGR